MGRSSASSSRGDRFRDPLLTIGDLDAHLLVECPACARCARLDRREDRSARFVCAACGRSEDGGWNELASRHRLWLTTSCAGEELWACNGAHLELLERYISAKLRERGRADAADSAVRNKSLVSRLPRWMKLAGHRAVVLRGLAVLRRRLEG